MRDYPWWIYILTIVVATFGAAPSVRAGCNNIPAVFASPEPTPGFRGALGMANRPFVEPSGPIRFARGACDPTPSATFPPAESMLVTLILKSANQAKPDALIVAGDDQCGKTETDACEAALGGGKAFCATTVGGALQVVDNGRQLRFTFPDLAAEQSVTQTAGDLTVVVTDRATSGCGVGPISCKTWKAAGTAGKHICIDELYDDASNCASNVIHRNFSALTALPPMLDFHSVCHADDKHCAPNKVTVSIATDRDENILVPVLWRDAFPSAAPTPARAEVNGRVVLPTPFKPTRKVLETFTAEGISLTPGHFEPIDTAPANVTGLRGSTDSYYSVVRIHNRVCDGGSSKDEPCTLANGCPDKANCVKSIELATYVPKTGVLNLTHVRKFLCEDAPDTPCAVSTPCGNGQGQCVGWVLEARSPAPTPVAVPLRVGGVAPVVQQTFAQFGTVAFVDASDDTIAAIIEFRSDPPEVPGVTGRRALIVADRAKFESSPTDDARRATFIAVKAKDGTVQTAERVAQLGRQTRFLSGELASAELGRARLAANPGPDDRLLKVYDRRTDTLVTVAIADPTRPDRDPLAAQEETGSTSFVSPAGQCVTGDGLVLPVPSLCRFGAAEDCPRGATCREARVVVAVNLLADDDGDGIPDVLEPGPRRAHAAAP